MVNILFSGINKETGFSKEQARCLQKYLKLNKNIVFIASDFNDNEKSQLYYEKLIKHFNNIGVNFKNKFLIDGRISAKESHNLLNSVEYVFLMGGNPQLQMQSIKYYNLTDLIKEKSIIIGVSAGSMNLSNIVAYKDDFNNNKLIQYDGLGLIDINIFPHIVLEDEKIMNEIKEISYIHPLLLLLNESFIVLDNNNIKYYGKYFLMKNGEIIYSIKY